MGFMVMIIYIELLQKVQPYASQELNDLEFKANIAAVRETRLIVYIALVCYLLRRFVLHQRGTALGRVGVPLPDDPLHQPLLLVLLDQAYFQQPIHKSC